MKNWLDCLPFIEFAYNRANHSATKLSPFEIVYGFKPTTPMDLTPLPPEDMVCQDGETKAETVQKLHAKVRDQLEKTTAQYKHQADKKRKEMVFSPGDWVWLHMRPERFPKQRRSKLDPRGDGPFKVLEKINDNAYKLELPDEVRISKTFNVSDLSPFSVDGDTSGMEALQEGGNDEDIEPPSPEPVLTKPYRIPVVTEPPKTRQGYRTLRGEFDKAITSLLSLVNAQEEEAHEEQAQGAKEKEERPSPTKEDIRDQGGPRLSNFKPMSSQVLMEIQVLADPQSPG